MKWFCFIIWLSYSELFLHFASCMLGLGNKNEYALAVQQRADRLDFAIPYIDNFGKFDSYRAVYEKFYYLCPEKRETEVLKVKRIVYEPYGPKEQICKYTVEPMILKVNTYLENYQRENTPMDKYMTGFSMNYDDFKDVHSMINHESDNKYIFENQALLPPFANTKNHNFKSTLEEKVQTYVLPMITVFTYATWKHIFAVSYKINGADVKKKLENTTLNYKPSAFFTNKIEEFYQNQESNLKKILDDQYDPQKHALKLGSLANENDFIVDIWKKTARYKIHQILIFESNIEMWRNIQEFARHVGGLWRSETTITAGTGNTLTISSQSGRKFEMKWGEGEDTIFIPELYWLAIKYYKGGVTTGMVIIMHNEPMEGNDVKKICVANLCVKNDVWMLEKGNTELEKRVYCCELNSDVIKKLGIGFIHKDYHFFQDDLLYSFPPRWEEDKVE